MADYTQIPDTALDPDAPLTSELAYAWRDNPIAIAEGAVGAPKVMGQALNTLLLYNQTSQAILTDLDRVDKIMHFSEVTVHLSGAGTAASSVVCNRSTDGGATWLGDFNIVTVSRSEPGSSSNSSIGLINVAGATNALRVRVVSTGLNPTMNVSMLSVNGANP